MTDKKKETKKDKDGRQKPRAKMMEKMSKRANKGGGCCDDTDKMSKKMEKCCGSDEESNEAIEQEASEATQEA